MKYIIHFSSLLILVAVVVTTGSVHAQTVAAEDETMSRQERRAALRTEFQKQKDAYKTHKASFLEARKAYRAAKDELTDDQRIEFAIQVHGYLTQTVETLVARLERLKAWVSDSAAFDAEQKVELVEQIDAQIGALRDGLADLAGASLEEMQTFARSFRNRLATYKQEVRSIVAKAKTYRLRAMWDKANNLAERIENKIAQLEELGIDVTEAQTMLDTAKASLAEGDDRAAVATAYKELRAVVKHLKETIRQHRASE